MWSNALPHWEMPMTVNMCIKRVHSCQEAQGDKESNTAVWSHIVAVLIGCQAHAYLQDHSKRNATTEWEYSTRNSGSRSGRVVTGAVDTHDHTVRLELPLMLVRLHALWHVLS